MNFRRRNRIAAWAAVLIGALIVPGSVVMGLLAPTAAGTLQWLIPECIGIGVLIPGLHMVIDP